MATAAAIKAADQIVSAATLTNLTGLSLPVKANVRYEFKFMIVFRTAATTTGIGLTVTIPSANIFSARISIPQAADGVDSEFVGHVTSSGDEVLSTDVPAATTDYIAIIEGVIEPSVDGDIQVQGRTEVGSSDATFREGSSGRLYQMG